MIQYTAAEHQKLRKIHIELLEEFIRLCEKHQLQYFAVYGTAIGAVRHQGLIPWDDDTDVAMLRADYDKFVEIAAKELPEKYDIYSAPIQKRVQGFYLQMFRKDTKFVTRGNVRWPMQTGIKLDIFPYDTIPTSGKARKSLYSKIRFWNMLYIIRNTKVPMLVGDSIAVKASRILSKMAYYVMNVCGPSIDKIVSKCVSLMTMYKEDTGYYTLLNDLKPDKWAVTREELFPLKEAEYEGIKIKIPNKNHEILTRQYGDYMTPPPVSEQVGHDLVVLEFPKE